MEGKINSSKCNSDIPTPRLRTLSLFLFHFLPRLFVHFVDETAKTAKCLIFLPRECFISLYCIFISHQLARISKTSHHIFLYLDWISRKLLSQKPKVSWVWAHALKFCVFFFWFGFCCFSYLRRSCCPIDSKKDGYSVWNDWFETAVAFHPKYLPSSLS